LQGLTVSFRVNTEVTPAYFEELLKYTYQNYIIPARERFANIKQTFADGTPILSFTFLESNGKWRIEVEMKTGRPILVTMTPSIAEVPQSAFNLLKEDLTITIQYFEELVRHSTLYFAWIEGKEVVPEKSILKRTKLLERIFLGNILFIFIVFLIISIVLFLIIGSLAILVLVISEFMIVLFSNRIIGRMADWTISEKNPKVHILQYHLSPEIRKDFSSKFKSETLLQMKKEIYDQTLAVGKSIECTIVGTVMSKYGLECQPEKMAIKTINIYQLVEKATKQFNLPIPKIAIANTMVPNAAASGPSPKHGVVLITTGLLVQLNEEEILTVLGHEFSHLKARDPLVLFTIATSEYLFRIYVLWNYIYQFGLFYLIFITGVIYFIGKFFEARADLDSAIKIGKPTVLADALRKIGFRRLKSERLLAYKIQDWVTWNPHPPIYFRIDRLESFGKKPIEVKHTLIQSIKDCIRGFLSALLTFKHNK
jgi:heat shock protein HtpX